MSWTSEQYVKYHKEVCDKLVDITARKNADYTAGRNADAFANFRMVDKLGICSIEQGFLTRMTDKLSRLVSLVTGHNPRVKDESIEDTLLDLANYCILLAGYLRSKKEPETTNPVLDPKLAGLRTDFTTALESPREYPFRVMCRRPDGKELISYSSWDSMDGAVRASDEYTKQYPQCTFLAVET